MNQVAAFLFDYVMEFCICLLPDGFLVNHSSKINVCDKYMHIHRTILIIALILTANRMKRLFYLVSITSNLEIYYCFFRVCAVVRVKNKLMSSCVRV